MTGKKGQLGKGISSVFVLIGIVLVLIAFNGSSYLLAAQKPTERSHAATTLTESLLVQKVIIEFDPDRQSLYVIEALTLNLEGTIPRKTLHNALQSLLSEQYNCYILLDDISRQGESTTGYILDEDSLHEIRGSPRNALPNWDSISSYTTTISINSQPMQITHYFGPCTQ